MEGKKSSSYCVVKYIFFAFNIIIWLLGCGLLSLGIWMQVNKGPYMTVLPSHSFLSATALCITAGCIILIIGFFGCCGSLIENQCMLIVYFVLVFVIFGLEIAVTVVGFTNKDQIRKTAEKELSYSIEYVTGDTQDENMKLSVQSMLDVIQQDLQCCGMYNFTDYFTIGELALHDPFPSSCCVEQGNLCSPNISQGFYKRGCLKEIEYWFVQNMYVMGVAGLIIAVIQIWAMISAILMFCCLRNDKDFL